MWMIPAEYGLHRQTWMAFPYDSRIWGSDLGGAQETVSKLVRAISCYERVCLLVPPNDEKRLSTRFRSSAIEVIAAIYNDIWVRDTLPTFAVGSDKSLVAIDWHFNGWGKTPNLNYSLDVKIGRTVARLAEAAVIDTDVVAEGGAFAFDGHDTIVATRSVMLHSKRNGAQKRDYIQKELHRASQCTSICWLPGDRLEQITRGHADPILSFANRNTVFFHWIEDGRSREQKICERNLQAFERWMDQEDRKYEISLSDLYFFLMDRTRDSHRFFIARILFESSLQKTWRGATMFDLVLLALGLGLFVVSVGYAYACDRL